MWRRLWVIAAGIVILAGARLSAQEAWREAPLGTRPLAGAPRADQRAPNGGAAENRWRYRFSDGRWWYWTPDKRWSYFDGTRWRPYSAGGGYVRRPVDPALLRLEYKEGVMGGRRWPRVGGGLIWQGGGAGLPFSGTQGSLGGSPSGSFTNLGGVDTGINTSIGTTTDVSGLNSSGRAYSGGGLMPNTGVGGSR